MSLALTQTLPTGAQATFWVIGSIVASMYNHTAEVTVDGYLSSDTYNAGDDPITSQVIEVALVPTTVFPNISLLTALYTKVLADPFFTTAFYTADGV